MIKYLIVLSLCLTCEQMAGQETIPIFGVSWLSECYQEIGNEVTKALQNQATQTDTVIYLTNTECADVYYSIDYCQNAIHGFLVSGNDTIMNLSYSGLIFQCRIDNNLVYNGLIDEMKNEIELAEVYFEPNEEDSENNYARDAFIKGEEELQIAKYLEVRGFFYPPYHLND